MIQVLDENVFSDPSNRYYITIDMLDEDWADDRVKFKLIRALIDSARQFRHIRNVKIILALRHDLLDKVIFLEAAPGFQEEKYKSLYLDLNWNKKNLIEIVDRRLNLLIKRRYTKEDISASDIFTSQVDGTPALDYMIERTFHRPRDIILFINECIALSEGRTEITAATIKEAEGRYSKERLQSLCHEWSLILPSLNETTKIFVGMKERFSVSDLTEDWLCDRFAEFVENIPDIDADPISKSLNNIFKANSNFQSIRSFIVREFHRIGLLGVKVRPGDAIVWSHLSRSERIAPHDIRGGVSIVIHPMFHRALGIRPIGGRGGDL